MNNGIFRERADHPIGPQFNYPLPTFIPPPDLGVEGLGVVGLGFGVVLGTVGLGLEVFGIEILGVLVGVDLSSLHTGSDLVGFSSNSLVSLP